MAKPRVFISSTFYDLRSVRDDLDRFIRGLGYEPVRHERGHISYGQQERPEEYAYREVDLCDILVCIIGGRFGSQAAQGMYSITQKELKKAVEHGKQVYVFVEEAVHHEHRSYKANKDVQGVKFPAVDDARIHEFLEEVYALPSGNPVFSFGVSSDISAILQEQWAGLFQRLLLEQASKPQSALVEDLQRSLQTVGQLVKFLAEEKGKSGDAVQEILFANHPIFEAIRKATNNGYRLYFSNLKELDEWAKTARRFEEMPFGESDDYFEWIRVHEGKSNKENQILFVKKSLFSDDGTLIPMTPAGWDDSWVRLERREAPKRPFSLDDLGDDIPF